MTTERYIKRKRERERDGRFVMGSFIHGSI